VSLLLSEADVKKILTMPLALECVENLVPASGGQDWRLPSTPEAALGQGWPAH